MMLMRWKIALSDTKNQDVRNPFIAAGFEQVRKVFVVKCQRSIQFL